MIRQLRRQFILIATGAILVILIAVVGILTTSMYGIVNSFVDKTVEAFQNNTQVRDDENIFQRFLGNLNSHDVFYYSIETDADYQVISYDDSHHTETLTEYTAQNLINQAEKSKNKNRFESNDSYYAWYARKRGSSYTFTIVDYSMLMRWASQIRNLAFLVGLAAFVFFEIMVIAFSGQAIRPAIRNEENQKRFITNASHELKTPVAVISADNEVLEAMYGENDWTRSISHQTKKLTGLINSLVQLSKSSESDAVELKDTDITRILNEQADSFQTLMESKGFTLKRNIPDNLHALTNGDKLSQVISILLDNAAKYCDDQGTIAVEAYHSGRHCVISVSNDYREGENIDYSKFFERFYRGDPSHNSKKSGFGIGLSIADQQSQSMKAKIRASWKEGRILFTITL